MEQQRVQRMAIASKQQAGGGRHAKWQQQMASRQGSIEAKPSTAGCLAWKQSWVQQVGPTGFEFNQFSKAPDVTIQKHDLPDLQSLWIFLRWSMRYQRATFLLASSSRSFWILN
jgi:hypothetical protein